ncbi:uroporphyrinogen-III synthase [Rhizobium terrae]|uniref:uroporphyrinogen-III synthase n=1 Tax=Rhizobium terrae TaxID=2171756 RepID=UPI000E3D82D8|nr:uroporphyrinogen-III synthase [Rhizobium terrae]
MRVVVTRPQRSALRTAGRLEGLGHQPVLLPLAKAQHHPQIAEEALKEPHSAVAVTSGEALRVLVSLGDQLAAHRDEILYAVGDATAKAAADAGFRNVRKGPGTGAGLAEVAAGDEAKPRAPLLYLAGKPRSPKFEDGLLAKELPFVTAEVYEMIPITYDTEGTHRLLCDPPADAVLLYSRETAKLFFDLVAPIAEALPRLRILCLSGTISEAVPHEFHRNIKIAVQPDEEGILALL